MANPIVRIRLVDLMTWWTFGGYLSQFFCIGEPRMNQNFVYAMLMADSDIKLKELNKSAEENKKKYTFEFMVVRWNDSQRYITHWECQH